MIPMSAPWVHILELREKAVQLKEERDQLRARLDDISQQNQQDLADALEQLSLEMDEKAKLEQERIKLDCEWAANPGIM